MCGCVYVREYACARLHVCGCTPSIYMLPPGGVSMIKFGQLNRSEFRGHLCTNFIFLFLQQLKISPAYYFGNKPDFPSVLTIHILHFNMAVVTIVWTLLFLIVFLFSFFFYLTLFLFSLFPSRRDFSCLLDM